MTAPVPPDWVADAVFYQIFPDRFARSPSVGKVPRLEPWDSPPTVYGYKGGDLAGVTERLDYLADLGVTALYLNPIFQSTANHRYVTTDYYEVDPILGGNAAFARFIDESHRRGMHVILDGVFNHTSRGFYPFAHILDNGAASPYLDWYSVKGFPLHAYGSSRAPNYSCWWNLRALPKLNTANPTVRQFLWDVGRHWIEQGADGWRLDVPNEIDDDTFWQEFRLWVKKANPQAYLVGEIWTPAERWLQGDQFDGVMNYVLGRACLGFFIEGGPEPSTITGTGYAHLPSLDAPAFGRAVSELLGRYSSAVNFRLLNLAGSHDTARLLTMARNDESAVRLTLLFLMTYPGAPCIYYGDEIGMAGGRDPDCRGAFPWEQSRWRHDLRAFVQRCIALRRAHPALRTGAFVPLVADAGVYAFLRRHDDEEMVVALNVSRGARALALPMDAGAETSAWRDVWGKQTARVEGGVLRGLSLAPRNAVVLKRIRPGK